MAKKVKTQIKLNLPAGEATPAPPVGPALGQHGIPIMEFIKEYNARTAKQKGNIIPAVITVYEDRSWDFVTKKPPVAELIKAAANIDKGSGSVKKQKVAKLSQTQISEIAQTKIEDLNARTLESAEAMVRGTARSMGVEVN